MLVIGEDGQLCTVDRHTGEMTPLDAPVTRWGNDVPPPGDEDAPCPDDPPPIEPDRCDQVVAQ